MFSISVISRKTLRQSGGFTLTEAAIVLGIVGLILGAIWVASASVYSNYRVNNAVKELIAIVGGVKGLGGTSASLNTPAGTEITQTIITLKIPPADLIGSLSFPIQNSQILLASLGKAGEILLSAFSVTPAYAFAMVPPPKILAPWPGSTIKVYSKGNNGDRFDVAFLTLPSTVCAQLLVNGTGQGIGGMGLVSVGASTTTSDPAVDGGGITALPVSLSTATTSCGATNTSSIAFRFSF